MKTYIIPVAKIGIGFRGITVTAKNQKEAEEKALNKAGNHKLGKICLNQTTTMAMINAVAAKVISTH